MLDLGLQATTTNAEPACGLQDFLAIDEVGVDLRVKSLDHQRNSLL
jgi:hypothetical protein